MILITHTEALDTRCGTLDGGAHVHSLHQDYALPQASQTHLSSLGTDSYAALMSLSDVEIIIMPFRNRKLEESIL